MKAILFGTTCLAVLGAIAGKGAYAEELRTRTIVIAQAPPAPPAEPAEPAPPAEPAAAAPSIEAEEARFEAAKDMKSQYEKAKNLSEAERQVLRELDGATKLSGEHLERLISKRRASGQSLVVRSEEHEGKDIAATQEDLSIMSRILEKAIQPGEEDGEKRVLGVVMSGDGVRNLQIEGYGAMFLLRVNFPLAGAPANPEKKSEGEANSTWEEARREIYGSATPLTLDGGRGSEFDPKRVERLKEAVVAALKNASNIRGLKENDSVTVVVTSGGGRAQTFELMFSGGPDGEPRRIVRGSGGGGGSGGFSSGVFSGGGISGMTVTTSSGGEGQPRMPSTLTIRARKSDIDAFAKGKMELEEFRKRVTIALY